MIIKNGKTITSVYKGNRVIDKIYKGTLLVYEGWKNLIASGVPPLTLNKCKGVDLLDYKLYGNSIQDGTPTPDTPIEVESVGNKTKNLLIPTLRTRDGLTTELTSDGRIHVYGICTRTTGGFEIGSYNLEAGTYTLSVNATGNYGNIAKVTFNSVTSVDFGSTKTITKSTTVKSSAVVPIELGVEYDFYLESMLELGAEVSDFEPYGYKIPVKVSGKNLYINKYSNYTQPLDYKICEITVKENTVYTLSTKLKDGKTALNSCTVGFATNGDRYSNFENFQITLGTSWLTPTKQITTTSNKIVLTVYADNEEIFNQLFDRYEIQLEEGSTATEFEPYVEPITTNIYLKEPLRKIGDYTDYIDFKNKKVIRNVANKIFDGTEEWKIHTTTDEGKVFRNENLLTPLIGASIFDTYMTHFALTDIYSTATFTNGLYRFAYTGAEDDRRISSSRVYISAEQTTVEDFKSWLAENQPIIMYPLATPIEETIELPNVPLNIGTNIIEVDTTIQPSNVEVVYKGKR